jgi:hypothetical protein
MVNFSTSAAGSLRVELQDSSGKAVGGYTLSECREIWCDAFRGIQEQRPFAANGLLQVNIGFFFTNSKKPINIPKLSCAILNDLNS